LRAEIAAAAMQWPTQL